LSVCGVLVGARRSLRRLWLCPGCGPLRLWSGLEAVVPTVCWRCAQSVLALALVLASWGTVGICWYCNGCLSVLSVEHLLVLVSSICWLVSERLSVLVLEHLLVLVSDLLSHSVGNIGASVGTCVGPPSSPSSCEARNSIW
jgi:hypothetical protein